MKTKCFIILICLFTTVKIFCQKDSLKILPAYPLKITLENLDKDKITKKYSRNLRINFFNTADSVFAFYIMSCSWHDCVRFNPDIASPKFSGCDKNSFKKIKLNPKDSFALEYEYSFSKIKKSTYLSVVSIITNLPELIFEDSINKESPFSMFKEPPFSIFWDSPKYTYKDFIWSKPLLIKF